MDILSKKQILNTKLSVEIIDAAEINEKVVGKITEIEDTINDFPNKYLLKNDDGSIEVPSIRVVSDSSDAIMNFSSKDSFIQGNIAISSNKSYGGLYTGTYGYEILSVINETNQLKLAGDLSKIADLLNNVYATDVPESIPTASKAVKLAHGGAVGSTVALKDFKFSFALGDQSGTLSFKIIAVEQINEEYGLVTLDAIPSTLKNAATSLKTEEAYHDKYLTDDNGIYVIGYPELGNKPLHNFYSQHAEGGSTKAIGKYTHTEGRDTIADMRYSHAEGSHNVAGEMATHVEGFYNIALGRYSHAEGYENKAGGIYSHAEGRDNIANNSCEHAEGSFNISHNSDEEGYTIHSVGIGTAAAKRQNAIEIQKSGKIFINGIGGYAGKTTINKNDLKTVIDNITTDINNLSTKFNFTNEIELIDTDDENFGVEIIATKLNEIIGLLNSFKNNN